MPDNPALVSFLQDKYGGNFEVQSKQVSVTTDNKLIIPNNFDRLGLTISNYGANDAYVYPGETQVGGQGIRLGSNGGIMSLTLSDDLVMVGYDFGAYTLSGTTDLYILLINRY